MKTFHGSKWVIFRQLFGQIIFTTFKTGLLENCDKYFAVRYTKGHRAVVEISAGDAERLVTEQFEADDQQMNSKPISFLARINHRKLVLASQIGMSRAGLANLVPRR
jgi:hypothetical protein